MALEKVPPYLVLLLRVGDPERLGAVVSAEGHEQLSEDAVAAVEALEAWVADDEFWSATVEHLQPDLVRLTADLDEDLLHDQELEILTEGVAGDRRLATLILLEMSDVPPRANGRDPYRARDAVARLRAQCHRAAGMPPTPRRRWRLARVLRRAFKAAGGGVLIAADIVAPDPSMIVKVASVLGGVDMIIDAVDSD